MRGAPHLLAAAAATAAMLRAACGEEGNRELQDSTAIYCYLLSTAIYYPML
jgi:hypothetical protein